MKTVITEKLPNLPSLAELGLETLHYNRCREIGEGYREVVVYGDELAIHVEIYKPPYLARTANYMATKSAELVADVWRKAVALGYEAGCCNGNVHWGLVISPKKD